MLNNVFNTQYSPTIRVHLFWDTTRDTFIFFFLFFGCEYYKHKVRRVKSLRSSLYTARLNGQSFKNKSTPYVLIRLYACQ